jgi:N6-adenosine-specific RNA methylase IME4
MRTIAQQLAFEIEAGRLPSIKGVIEANHQSCDSSSGVSVGVDVERSGIGAAIGEIDAAADLLSFAAGRRFATVLADPPWRFTNRTGKMAPEHRRLSRYGTMTVDEIASLPVPRIVAATAHLYLWVPNALLPEGLRVLQAWGFEYKTNVIWHKLRKDGGSDGRGVGFYFRNVTEMVLFGVRGKNARTLSPGRRQVNYIGTRKREHSRKPDEQYPIIEACSPGPYLELFARGTRPNWATWGNQADDEYRPTWPTYSHHSRAEAPPLD